MTKPELLAFISALQLDADFKAALTDMVTEVREVDDALVMVIADLLDGQADFHQATAQFLDAEQRQINRWIDRTMDQALAAAM